MHIRIALVATLVATALAARAETPPTAAALFAAIDANDAEATRKLLARDPKLAAARTDEGISAVIAAGTARSDAGFIGTHDNPVLAAILARSPELDVFDAALVGDNKRLAAFVAKDPKVVTAFSPLGWQPLMLASFGGNLDGVKLLVAKAADVNARASTRFRNTSLQIALLRGEGPVIVYLLEHGADPNVRQNQDFVALHEAVLLGRTDLIQLLLDHGAEVNARNAKGETPLGSALRRGKTEAASYLKARGGTE
jgi:ankyrin repeat protein